MKILKHGIKKEIKPKLFACNNCTCEFECDPGEWSTVQGRYNEQHHIAICPECNNKVYIDA